MAKKVVVSLVDDLDGGRADQTIQFGLDGADYEIDLSTDNVQKLRAALDSYVTVARPCDAGRRPRRSRAPRTVAAAPQSVDRAQNQAIRDWARRRGMFISDRGRISATVLKAYHQEA